MASLEEARRRDDKVKVEQTEDEKRRAEDNRRTEEEAAETARRVEAEPRQQERQRHADEASGADPRRTVAEVGRSDLARAALAGQTRHGVASRNSKTGTAFLERHEPHGGPGDGANGAPPEPAAGEGERRVRGRHLGDGWRVIAIRLPDREDRIPRAVVVAGRAGLALAVTVRRLEKGGGILEVTMPVSAEETPGVALPPDGLAALSDAAGAAVRAHPEAWGCLGKWPRW